MFRKTVIVLLLFFYFLNLNSQVLSKKEFIKTVQNADVYYYYEEDYEKAAAIYETLLSIYPQNLNITAKLGICYLNLDGKTADALQLLIKASNNIVSNDKEYTEYGEKAPLDTYLYLAIAYHKNDSLQKAISLFNDAKKRLAGTELFKEEYIDNQIRDCRYAIEMKKKPLTLISELFAPWLVDYPGACNPAVSKNDSVFVFTQKKDGKTQIFCSYKSGNWKKPTEITSQLGGYDRLYSNSITGDGKLLIVYINDGGDGNLYFSHRKDSTWTKIKSLGKFINSIYWESHGFITPDGNTIYFASNRPGGEGELDIWVSEKSYDGTWRRPVNCGNVINTPYNEDTPFYDPSTKALLFSSVGHTSMGGSDIFRSVNRNGSWTNPVGLPYAFNNIEDNTFFITNNNAPGFITSLYNTKTYSRNIYSIVAEDPADKITSVHGTISLQDGLNIDPRQTIIKLADIKKSTQIKTIPLLDTISFKTDVKPGDYQIFVSHKGYKTDTINLNIPLYYLGNYICVTASLVPDKILEGMFLTINNILFELNSYMLNDKAITSIELLKSILINYPELKIEVAGYTDSRGSSAYNLKLADKRAQAVIDYLTSAGLSGTRFVKKAFGESNFAAINTNPDGTDNPEGRKFNRRATFGIIDPQTGIIIRQETYTPEHLRSSYSMKYSIVLLKTSEKLDPGYFSGLIKDDMLFVRTIKADTVLMYTLGVFYNRSDAFRYLSFAREKGLDKAYIVNQYDLDNESKSVSTSTIKNKRSKAGQKVYTIQLKATRNPLNIEKVFNELEGITEIKTADGLFKYVYGEYNTFSKAKTALLLIKKSGYEDAFIRDFNEMISR
jgi:outer membrane protein OmpA-like peptidoglycan-associated protein